MTEKEFVQAHEHELMGWIIDAMTCGLSGDLRSMRLRELMQKVRARLGMMYTQLKTAPPLNGQHGGPLKMVQREKD